MVPAPAARDIDGFHRAHGLAIPRCIAPFRRAGWDGFAACSVTRPSNKVFAQIWNGEHYQAFRSASSQRHALACLCRLRTALELVTMARPRVALIIPTLNEEEAIGGVL